MMDGSVWAAGDNSSGQLGDGGLAGRAEFARVRGLPVIQAVAAGADFSVALDRDGGVWVWGANWRNVAPGVSRRWIAVPERISDSRRATWIAVRSGRPAAGDGEQTWSWGEASAAASALGRESISLSASAVIAQPTAGSGTFTVTADEPWTATTTHPFLTVQPTSGSGTRQVTYSFGDNPYPNARLASIVIGKKTLLVTQTSVPGAYTQWANIPYGYIRTIAGKPAFGDSGDGGPALQATLRTPKQIVVDGNGNLYVATINSVVRRIDGSTGVMTTITGAGGDGVALDVHGNLYVSDAVNHRVNKVAAGTGVITPFAGTGAPGYAGDGGAPTAAQLTSPGVLVFDAAGNLYFADGANLRIRRIDGGTGNISTFAGTGVSGFSGDGGQAINAQFAGILSMAFDSQGNLFLADATNYRIRKIAAGTNLISTVAGNGTPGESGDGVDGVATQFYQPESVALDAADNLYVGDRQNCRVRVIASATGKLGTLTGRGLPGLVVNNSPASFGTVCPSALAVDPNGNVYVGDAQYPMGEIHIVVLATNSPVINPGSAGHPAVASGGSIVATSTSPVAAPWYVTRGADWLTVNLASGTGTGEVQYTVAENASFNPRDSWIQVGAQRFRVHQTGAAVTLAPSTVAAGPGPGSGTINLSISPALAWTAQSSAAWLTISPANGTGSQALTYAVTVNPSGTARTATVVIAGKVAVVVQAGANGSYSPWGTGGRGTIRTIAGNGTAGYSGDNGPATSAAINGVAGIAVDPNGNVFLGDFFNSRLRRVAAGSGVITTAAGNGTAGSTGDDGPAAGAQISGVKGAASDTLGNLYFSDSFYNHRVRKIEAGSLTMRAVAGFYYPSGLAFDASGNLYIADQSHRILRLDAGSSVVTTFAGTGTPGFAGDGGPALSAAFNSPAGVAVDSKGNVFVCDSTNQRIRRIDVVSGLVSTYAGTGVFGLSGDGGPASAAQLNYPGGIAIDANDILYIADANNHRVRRIDLVTGIITTAVGTTSGFSGDGAVATAAQLKNPTDLAVDTLGNLYIFDQGNNRIRYVNFGSPAVTLSGSMATVPLTAGSQSVNITTQPAGAYWAAASDASWLTLSAASGSGDATLTYTFTANPYTWARVAHVTVNNAILTVTQPAPAVSISPTFAVMGAGLASSSFALTVSSNAMWIPLSSAPWLGLASGANGGNATITFIVSANTGTTGRTGTILVAGKVFTVTQGAANGTVTPWGPSGSRVIQTIAGTGAAGSGGDGGAALAAVTGTPRGIAAGANGDVYFSEFGYHRVRKINASTRMVSAVAGSGASGFSGDQGLAPFAQLNQPAGLAVDFSGNVYIADRGNNRVRRVDAASGNITTAAGLGTVGYSGDGGQSSVAQLSTPMGVALDVDGNLYIADTGNHAIRRVDRLTNLISTIAGTGVAGSAGDGGAATAAQLNAPSGVAVDPDGNVYIADAGNGIVRKIAAATGTITTVAGFGGSPVSVSVDANGNVFVLESAAFRIRKLTVATDDISTVGGAGSPGFSGDGGQAVLAQFSQAYGVASDGIGNVFLADTGNNRIRFVDNTTPGKVPTLVSALPTNTTATSTQTFTLTARDADGYADISRFYFQLGSGSAPAANGCHGFYDRALNAFYLYNDALTALAGPLSPGSGGSIQNSQCAVNGATSWVTTSGTDVTLALNLTRQGNYATGAKTLFIWVIDAGASGTGWVTASAWTPVAQQPSVLVVGTPGTATGATRSFTFTARDPNGFADIGRIYFLVNRDGTIPANTCHGFYDRALNQIYLYNDGLTSFGQPLTPGAAATLANSQCSINGAGSAVGSSGTDLILELSITRIGSFAAAQQTVYGWVTGFQSPGAGWQAVSEWSFEKKPPPILVGATPATATKASQTFYFLARDYTGVSSLSRIYFLVNGNTSISPNTCHGFYDRAANATFLYNDSLTGLTTTQNSQCAITASTATESGGSDLLLILTLTRQGSYATGSLNVYAWITDTENSGTGWLEVATWSTGSQQPPTLASGTQAVGNTTTQTIGIVARDLDGVEDLNRIYFLVNSDSSIPANTCHGFYDRAANATFLYNDALTGLTTTQNSQCAIQASSAGEFGGTDLRFYLTLTRQGSYATGTQNVYVWITDKANTGTGWLQVATWTISSMAQPPTVVSATPATASAATETFTVTARHISGAVVINRIYFLLNTDSVIPAGSCHGFYDRPSNSILLYNDGLSGLVGPVTPGVAGTAQNSQCAINGAASSVLVSGLDLVLNLSLTRQGSYATGVKTLYYWVVDNVTTGTGWVPASNWAR